MESNEPTSTTPENTGTTQPEVELVRVEDAEDSEIADYLKKAEAEGLDAEPESEDVEESDETLEAEPAKEPQKAEEPKAETQKTYTHEEFEALKKELVEQRMANEQKEAFLQRRNTEYGETKRQLAEANAYLQKLISEDSFDSPAQAAEAVIQLKENERNIQAIDAEQQKLHYVHEWHETVGRYVDPKQVQIDDAVEILQEHKIDPRAIEAFRRNPIEAARPLEALYLFEAAKWRKTTKQLVNYVQKLQGDLEKSKSKPEEVLRGVEKALRSSPTVNGSAGASSARKSGKDSDPSKWSDAEINEFLKQSQN